MGEFELVSLGWWILVGGFGEMGMDRIGCCEDG